MGGEIFKDSLRKLEVKSIQKFQKNTSLETRQNSLSNDINLLKNESALAVENLSQRPRKREINKFTDTFDAFSRKIITDKSILANITHKTKDEIKETINNLQKFNIWLKECHKSVNAANFKAKMKIFNTKQNVSSLKTHQTIIIKEQSDSKLNLNLTTNNLEKITSNRFKFGTKDIIKVSIFINRPNYWFNFNGLNLLGTITTRIDVIRYIWLFDPGILILYNLILVKMNTLFSNLNITFNCEWRTILTTANSCRQWLAYFDEQYLENYWHAFYEDERIHIVESIANDYFNTFQHYNYRDAIIMFYINQNLDRVYYFDHKCINIEPYNLPEFPDSNTVLKIRFDVIINDPIEFNRLFE